MGCEDQRGLTRLDAWWVKEMFERKMGKFHKWNGFGTCNTVFFSLSTQIICILMSDYDELGILLPIYVPFGKSPGEEWSPPTGGGVWLLLTSCVTWQWGISVPHRLHL